MENCRSKEEQADLFLRYWTIKESAAKVSGLGMRIPFADIRLTEDCRIEVKWKDNIWKYFLREIEIPDEDDIMGVKTNSRTGKDKYRIAVCAETAEFAQS